MQSPESRPGAEHGSVAESLLDALVELGIDHVFANAGTDFAPLIEALASHDAARRARPKFLTIPHENLAISMANGYYRASGKPAAVMVHVTVGTANAVCGLMNAYRDNVPLLLVAGRTPITERGDKASRSLPIHWGQESFDQAGIVREYTKWSYELRAGQCVHEVLRRALDVALAEPRGPVYLTLPREVLAAQSTARASRLPPTTLASPAPSSEHVELLASWITAAEQPVIVTTHLGRDAHAATALAELSAAYAIPVADAHASAVNLPANHPMSVGDNAPEVLADSDLILVIDAEVPWFPRAFEPPAGARVAHLGIDPLWTRYPIRGFPADLVLPGASAVTLAALARALERRGADAARVAARRESVARHRAARERYRAERLARARSAQPIELSWLAACLREAMPPGSLIVSELGPSAEALGLVELGSFLGVGIAGGLGFALGAALGAKLAAPGRTVIAALGDGSYMFGNPTPFHFVSRAAALPVLAIVCNNSAWYAVEEATLGVYPQGAAARAAPMPLVELAPTPEFTKVAEASGAFARRVEHPGELPQALAAAFASLARGQQALLDVRTARAR
jgi:acetolactate synthase I/II/III large subunit